MKRLLAFGMSLGLVAAIAAPAMAGGSADKVTGDVDRLRDNTGAAQWSLVFNAHEEKDGRPAKGMAYAENLNDPTNYWRIDVTCASIEGNVGLFAGVVDVASKTNFGIGDYILVKVEDNGEPGTDDLVWSNGAPTAAQIDLHCSGDNQATAKWFVTAGNLQVHAGESAA